MFINNISRARCLLTAAVFAAAAYGGVIEEIETDIAADPDNADLYVELAMEYEYANDWREAVDAYLMALALVPNDADVHFRLAEVYFAVDKLEPAIDEYRKAVALDENLNKAHYQIGRAYFGMKRYDEAVVSLEKYAGASPYDFNGLWFLGRALEKVGRKRDALERYEKILDYSTGAYAAVGEIGDFGTSDDLAAYVRKLKKEVYGE
jgi:tetratricopeptide (TPR) repeat protein